MESRDVVDSARNRWRRSDDKFDHRASRVSNSDEPAPVPVGIVEALQSREDANAFTKSEQRPPFRAGEKGVANSEGSSRDFGSFLRDVRKRIPF